MSGPKALGLGGKLQSEQVSEREIFEKLAMEPGDRYLMSGCVRRGDVTFIVSHAFMVHSPTVFFHGLKLGAGIAALEARRGSCELFADAVSLAW